MRPATELWDLGLERKAGRSEGGGGVEDEDGDGGGGELGAGDQPGLTNSATA